MTKNREGGYQHMRQSRFLCQNFSAAFAPGFVAQFFHKTSHHIWCSSARNAESIAKFAAIFKTTLPIASARFKKMESTHTKNVCRRENFRVIGPDPGFGAEKAIESGFIN